MKSGVLYLMIVSTPTTEEMAVAKATIHKALGSRIVSTGDI
jgi:hypothetical protein